MIYTLSFIGSILVALGGAVWLLGRNDDNTPGILVPSGVVLICTAIVLAAVQGQRHEGHNTSYIFDTMSLRACDQPNTNSNIL